MSNKIRCYMRKNANAIVVTMLVIIAAGLLLSLVLANHREIRILSIHVGSNRFEVEHYLGEGQPNHSHGAEEGWLTYEGNPSLWFGRFEDSVAVCYSNNTVIKVYRLGL